MRSFPTVTLIYCNYYY